MILDHAKLRPDDLAVDDLTRTRSFAELADRSTRVARWLREDLGLGPEDHAALLMGNRVEYVELVLGAIMAGVWLTPINRHLAADEIAYVVADSGSRVIVSDDEHAGVARQALGGRAALGPRPAASPGHAARAAIDRSTNRAASGSDAQAAGAEDYTAATESRGSQVLVVAAGAELDAALTRASAEPMPLEGPAGGTMFYTSGTTGRPKGVKRARAGTVGQALTAAGTAGARLGLDGSGPHLVTGPLYHAAPLLFAIYDQANGAPLLVMPRWDEAQALRLIVERGVRHTHLVPTMFVRLLRYKDSLGIKDKVLNELESALPLDLVLHGAAPVAEHVKAQMIDWWGEVLVEYWGATEAGVSTLVGSRDWLAHPGTVGRPTDNFEVFAVGEGGERLPDGEAGVLYCRHKTLEQVFEYHHDPEKTAAVHPEPGVFTTGDIGRVDAEGYVYLLDRQANMIVSGGVNIYPAEVEQVLQQHAAVADVGVFGVPDDEWGESVKAAVELVAGAAAGPELEADILAFARERLAAYKVPRSIDFEAALPRYPTGKLHIRQIRDRYWRGRARNI